jgi:ubiquinone/menaquinone biosynthesis C-methylase UbiE
MPEQLDAVARQFGSHAGAYLVSAVHATGEDLRYLDAAAAAAGAPMVLDLGCGAGHASFAVAASAACVVAFDVSREMLDVVARAAGERGLSNIVVRQGSTDSLPFEDSAFDLVVSRFSAHHWAEWQQGLREAARVLRPGGRLIVIDIVSPEAPMLDSHLQTVELLRDPSHVRDHSARQWRAAFDACGMQVSTHRTWKLRMEFRSWVERSGTTPQRRDAIAALFGAAPREVTAYFQVEADGSFSIDAGLFEAVKRS